MKEKIFKVSIIGNSCPIVGYETNTFDMVWDSVKSIFVPGTRILVEDDKGNIKIFEKEK